MHNVIKLTRSSRGSGHEGLKESNDARATRNFRHINRYQAVSRLGANVSALLDKVLHDVQVALLACDVQWSKPILQKY